MEIGYSGRQVTLEGKHTTLLDRFVLDFTAILWRSTPYVVVSGYVAILFGRSRGTEDIDILIPPMGMDAFQALHDSLLRAGYEFLNAEDARGLHEMLAGRTGVRIAVKDQVIPNIELKYLKDKIDEQVLSGCLTVLIPGGQIFISPIEIQIPYKLSLGSDKDIEDALYLWEIFRGYIDHDSLRNWMNRFGIRGDEYAIPD
jgi:hypothetical protein